MKKKNSLINNLAIGLVGWVILAGAQCTPFGTPSPQTNTAAVPRVSWEPFTSPLMHYSIDYPATWYTWSGSEFFTDLEEAESDVDYFSILPRKDSFTITADQVLISIDLDTKQQKVPGEAATENFNDIISANSKTDLVSNVKALVIDNTLPAVQQVEQNPDDTSGLYGYTVVTYIDVGSVVYTFYVTTASATDYARYADIIQTMLESFAKQ